VCNDGSGSRLGSYDMSTYPGSGPSSPEVKPLLLALVFILSTRWLTRLLELYCLEVEEEVSDLPILRVQAPLYRQGPSYSLASGCLATGSPVAVVLAWVPPSSGPRPKRRPLYKEPFSLDRHIWGICPRFASDPFVGKGLPGAVGGERAWLVSCWSPASVVLVGTLLPLIKRRLKVFVIFAGFGLQG
jgi:hypothetical protein